MAARRAGRTVDTTFQLVEATDTKRDAFEELSLYQAARLTRGWRSVKAHNDYKGKYGQPKPHSPGSIEIP